MTATVQRPAGHVAFIPEDTEPLQGLAQVHVDLVRAVACLCVSARRQAARCPDQRIDAIAKPLAA